MDTNDPMPIADLILRKQLQILKWGSLFTKAAAFHRIQKALYYMEKNRYKQIGRCQSDISPVRSRYAFKLKSRIQYSSAPDLKILDCASTDAS